MVELDIRLLGPPQVAVAGTPVEVDTRKAIAILARLAVDGPQRRETLAALLWPESNTSRARGALRRTLSALKTTIDDPALVIGREEIHLEPGAYRCDVDAARELVARARAHHDQAADVCKTCVDDLTEAVTLHRGDFLSGFSLRDSPDFDDWQFFQAETFRHEVGAALDLLVNALAHRGDLEDATEHARRRLTIDPLHEPTHRRLMLLHAWSGRREEAIRQYRDCVATLERELGVAPLEDTTSLYQSVLAGRAPPPPSDGHKALAINGVARPAAEIDRSAATEVPTAWPLVDRNDEFDRLVEAQRSIATDGRLVVVEGEAGIGKTRLLEEFVARARSDGATALTVRCYPGEETLAYAPVADALRAVTSGDGADTVGRSWLSEVSRLVPELLERDPRLSAPAPRPGCAAPSATVPAISPKPNCVVVLKTSCGPAGAGTSPLALS
jgi:DNA-binding SARP family transcriptional activator